MIELYKLDSDVLVGHNISGFDLDVLLHRAQVRISFQCFLSEKKFQITLFCACDKKNIVKTVANLSFLCCLNAVYHLCT